MWDVMGITSTIDIINYYLTGIPRQCLAIPMELSRQLKTTLVSYWKKWHDLPRLPPPGFLIQRVDLMPYFQRLDRIENSLRNISLACDEINCTHVQIIKEMNIQTIKAKNNVERVIDLLKSHGEGPTRVKRGLLNFIGSLERILFGTVDAWTEAEIQELDVSANDTKKLSNLLANQTELICTEFSRFRDKDNELRDNIDSLTITLDGEMKSNRIARAIALIADNIMQFELDHSAHR